MGSFYQSYKKNCKQRVEENQLLIYLFMQYALCMKMIWIFMQNLDNSESVNCLKQMSKNLFQASSHIFLELGLKRFGR